MRTGSHLSGTRRWAGDWGSWWLAVHAMRWGGLLLQWLAASFTRATMQAGKIVNMSWCTMRTASLGLLIKCWQYNHQPLLQVDSAVHRSAYPCACMQPLDGLTQRLAGVPWTELKPEDALIITCKDA